MKVSENFVLQEFICPEIYNAWGEKSIQFIDFNIIMFAQRLRDKYGKPLVINNWHTGGKYKDSGLRRFNSKTGAKMSQHRFGRAVDIKILLANGTIDPKGGERLREFVKKNYLGMFSDIITTIEADTEGWLHADCRYTGKASLLIVPNPNIAQ
jgi:hypothetical protein